MTILNRFSLWLFSVFWFVSKVVTKSTPKCLDGQFVELVKIKMMKLGIPVCPGSNVRPCLCTTVESQVQLSNVLPWLNLQVLWFITMPSSEEIMNCANTCDGWSTFVHQARKQHIYLRKFLIPWLNFLRDLANPHWFCILWALVRSRVYWKLKTQYGFNPFSIIVMMLPTKRLNKC